MHQTIISKIAASNTGSLSFRDTDSLSISSVAGVDGINISSNPFDTIGGDITQSQAILAGISSFTAGANAITLTNASNDFSGAVSLSNSGSNDVSLTDANALDLGTVGVGQNLAITASGAITDSGVVTVAGTTTFDNSGGSDAAIDLGSSSTYTGNVSFTTDAGSDVTITDNSAFAIQSGLNVNNLSITSTGSVTDLGDLDIDGTLTVSAAGQTVDLSGGGSNDITGGVTLTGAAVTLGDSSATAIAGITATGALSVTSGGAISQSGAIDADSTASFAAGANAITLTNASNDFSGAVSLSNSGSNDVSLTDANALDLGTVGVGQNLAITASGAITDSGVVTVAGTTTFDNSGGSDAAIDLGSSSTYTGNVSFTTDAGSDVTITDNSAFAIQSGLNVNNLSITSTGSVTDLGDLDIDGTLTVSAAGQTVDLSGGGSNDITGGVTLTGAAVTLGDSSATAIAGITATGALSVTSGGAISQSGAIDADSTASFAAGANAITLTNASNDFSGAVSLSNSGSNDVSLTDANALDLGTVGVGQNLAITASGAITDSGVVTVAGTTTFDNSGGSDAAIDLGSSSTYTGNVSFTTDAGSDVTITDNSAFAIQSGLNVNNLSITSTGSVTDLGDLDIDGTLTVSAAGQTVDLSGGGSNDITGGVTLTGAAVTLGDSSATAIAGITATGALSVTSGGAISQSGAIDADSTASFAAGANAITLTNASNDFSGAVSLSNSGSNDVSLTDANALDLGTVGVGQNLT